MSLQASTKPKCPKCNDIQLIQVPPKEPLPPGASVPVRFCECRAERKQQRVIERYVPEMWRGLRVKDLQPSVLLDRQFPVWQQREVIQSLMLNPLSSHSFFGHSGTGKSRFLHCLLQEAVHAGHDVFFSKMYALLKAIRDNEFGRLPEERWHEMIDADDLRQRTSQKPLFIFIDEIDKIPFTDDAYLKLFELIDTIYENTGSSVLTICSNLSIKSFTEIWGEALTRRIMAVTNVHELGGKH
jgi:hypothetical protein